MLPLIKKLLLKSDLSYKKEGKHGHLCFPSFYYTAYLFFFTLKGHIPGFPDIIH